MVHETLMLQSAQRPMSTNALRAPDSLGGASFPAFFSGLGLLLLGLTLALIGLVRHQRRLRSARRALDPKQLLQAGVQYVRGKVVLDGAEPPVCVRIHQTAEKHTQYGYRVERWYELSRNVSSRPFYLEHASGELIRVEPGQEVFLVDALSRVAEQSETRRTRIAELTEGEMASIRGVLAEGKHDRMRSSEAYRTAPRGWILRPIGSEKMLISTEPLEDRHRKRRIFHAVWMTAFAIGIVVFGLLNHPMVAWMFGRGQVVHANIDETATWTASDGEDGGLTVHYAMRGRLEDAAGGRAIEEEISKAAFSQLSEALKRAKPQRVPFWKWGSTISPGTHPSIPIGLGGFDLAVGLVPLILFAVMSITSRNWYDRGTVDETEYPDSPKE